MNKLTAALRIAKVLAHRQQLQTIDLDCFYAAMQFMVPTATDDIAQAAGVDPTVLTRTQALPGGSRLIEEYRLEPQIQLSANLVQLKEKLASTEWANEEPRFAATGEQEALADLIAEAMRRIGIDQAKAAKVSSDPASLRQRLEANLLGQPLAVSTLCEELAVRRWKLDTHPVLPCSS